MKLPIPKKAIVNLNGQMSLRAKVRREGVYEPLAKTLWTYPPLGCPTEFARDELNPRYTKIKNFPHIDVIERELGDVPLLGEEDYWAKVHVREGSRSLWPGKCHGP